MTLETLVPSLAARGLTLRLVGNRINAFDAADKPSWPLLTHEEVDFIRSNRADVKRLILGLPPVPRVAEPMAENTDPRSNPEPPIPEHVRRVIDYNASAEVERRRREATTVMLRQLNRTSPFL
jgi:hypothetical protein